jgi:hypothetical protein
LHRKVSEKISAALKGVNCPYILNPIQLQGLDLPIIYQVLQWLVKKLLETRDERNEINRKNASCYFKTNFNFKQKIVSDKHKDINKNEINNVLDKTKYSLINKGRIFRPITKQNFEYNDPLKIYFTLIEYGMNKDLSFQRTLIDFLKKRNLIEDKEKEKENLRRKTMTGGSQATSKKEEKESNLNNDPNMPNTNSTQISISNDEKKILEEILSNNIKEISTGNINYQRINTSVMEEIFSENVEAIISEIEKYENIKEDESFDKIKFFVKEKERLDNNISNLIIQINEYDKELNILREFTEKNKFEIIQSTEEIQKLTNTLDENVKFIKKFSIRIKTTKN